MMHDFPLVLFTILSQLAVGALVTLWLLEATGRKISAATGFLISASVAGISIVGVLASLFHLGHPFEAYRALTNIGESWLSREVAFYSVFIFLSIVYCLYWKNDTATARKNIGALAALFGVATVVSSAMIYTIPAIPAWNNASTTISFFLTAVVLGPLFVGTLLRWKKEVDFGFSAVTLVSLGVSAFVFVVYVSSLYSGLQQAVMSGDQILSNAMFWIRALLFAAAFGMLLPDLKNKKNYSVTYYTAVFSLLVVSELLSRILFYGTAVHL